jgi:hypothetical protein
MKRVDLKIGRSRSKRNLLSLRALDGSIPQVQELITEAKFEDGESVSIVSTVRLEMLERLATRMGRDDEPCPKCKHSPHLGLCARRSGGTAYACGCEVQTPTKARQDRSIDWGQVEAEYANRPPKKGEP